MKFPLAPLLSLLMPVLAAAQDGGRLLPPIYETGKTYLLQSQYHGEVELGAAAPNKAGAGKQVVKMTAVLSVSSEEDAANPGGRRIRSFIKEAKLDLTMGNVAMNYDSTQPGSEKTLLGQSLHQAIGKIVTFVLDEKGQVLRVEGVEAFPALANGINLFGPDQLKQMTLPALSLGIPENGALPGETWRHDTAVNLGQMGKVNVEQTLTYKGDVAAEGGKLAVVENTASIGMNLDAEAVRKAGGMNIRGEDGTIKGRMVIDKERRLPREGTSDIHLTLVMPNPLNQAETVRLPVVNKVSFKLLDVREN